MSDSLVALLATIWVFLALGFLIWGFRAAIRRKRQSKHFGTDPYGTRAGPSTFHDGGDS